LLTDKQTDKQRPLHNLLSGGNKQYGFKLVCQSWTEDMEWDVYLRSPNYAFYGFDSSMTSPQDMILANCQLP